MTNLISKYKSVWGDTPKTLLDGYNYQRELTAKLDVLKPEDLDVRTFYEIVLWKLNRFPSIQDDLLDELKTKRDGDGWRATFTSSPSIGAGTYAYVSNRTWHQRPTAHRVLFVAHGFF